MKAKHQRAIFIVVAMLIMLSGLAIILTNFRDNFLYFYTPSELADVAITSGQTFRLGGLVEEGSIETISENEIRFVVTDYNDFLKVYYKGSLPTLFREGQGVVATGSIDTKGTFIASEILAKHDENYMPPKVAETLKKNDMWHHFDAGNSSSDAPPAASTLPEAP